MLVLKENILFYFFFISDSGFFCVPDVPQSRKRPKTNRDVSRCVQKKKLLFKKNTPLLKTGN